MFRLQNRVIRARLST